MVEMTFDITLSNLQMVVKGRKARIAKQGYKEKLDGQFASYLSSIAHTMLMHGEEFIQQTKKLEYVFDAK